MHVPPRRRQNQNTVAIDELRIDADAVLKSGLSAHILFGHIIHRINFARVANADRHSKVPQPHAITTRCILAKRVNRVHRLFAALDFELCHAVGVRAIATRQMNKVHVGHLTTVVHRAPRATNRVQMRRDDTVADCLLKRLTQEGGKHRVFFAVRFNFPLARGPVFIGLRITADALHKLGLIHTSQMEHDAGGLHLFDGCFYRCAARSGRNVSVACGINNALGQYRFTPRF